jgi:hypothetical protein
LLPWLPWTVGHACRFLAAFRLLLPPSIAIPPPGLLTTVGHNPHPIPFVRGANRPSTHHDRPAGVPEFFQTSEHCIASSAAQSRYIFSEYPSRSNLVNDSQHLEPETRPLAFDPLAFAGRRDVLAGETSADDVDGKASSSPQSVRCNIMHILELDRVGPKLLQAEHTAGVVFTLGDSLDPSGQCR